MAIVEGNRKEARKGRGTMRGVNVLMLVERIVQWVWKGKSLSYFVQAYDFVS